LQPPYARDQKWVLIVSTLFGCPVRCPICDAGTHYEGKLSAEEIFSQIDYPVLRRFPDRKIAVEKFKIQFARMGDPAFNPAVLDVLQNFPDRYDAPGFLPSISTIAPYGTDKFFERLLRIKKTLYKNHFQMQFSIHTTEIELRDRLIPIKKWNFAKIAQFGEKFFELGDRKISLNFALAAGSPLEPEVLLDYFDPSIFLVKITPVNPTYSAKENGVISGVDIELPEKSDDLIAGIQDAGYDVILSVGESDENLIGSNCGQYVRTHLIKENGLENGYSVHASEAAPGI